MDMGGAASRQDARDVVDEATAGDVHEAMDLAASQDIDHAVHVNAGWPQQGLADRAAQLFDEVIDALSQFLKKDLADQRVAVGVKTRGGQPDDPVADPDVTAVDDGVPVA